MAADALHVDGRLGFDPDAAVAHLRRRDPVLGRFIDTMGPFALSLDPAQSVFHALAEAIVYQQLTGKAAATIFGRVRDVLEATPHGVSAAGILATSDDSLRGAGLSRAKLLALRDLAERDSAGLLPGLAEVHGMDDEAVVEQLVAVRGIGRWTAQMLLIFRLGRPDVLPVDDYGIRKGFAAVFRRRGAAGGEATRAEVAARGERWAPYRTVASWYLWRAVDTRYGTSAAG